MSKIGKYTIILPKKRGVFYEKNLDIFNAIDLLNGRKTYNMRKVRLYSDRTLNGLLDYSLFDKDILTKVNSIDEVFDFINLSYDLSKMTVDEYKKYYNDLSRYIGLLNKKGILQSFVSDNLYEMKKHSVIKKYKIDEYLKDNEEEYTYQYFLKNED